VIIDMLVDALERCERGPSGDSLRGQGESDDFKRGLEAERTVQASWRESWVTDGIRRALAYLEGAATAREIEHFAGGYRHRLPRDGT